MTNDNAAQVEKPSVVVSDYGVVQGWGSEWPSGRIYMEMMEKAGIATKDETAEYWQASARWALLKKYNYLPPESLQDPYVQDKEGQRHLRFSDKDLETIQQTWQQVQQQALSSDDDVDDLQDLMKTSTSSGRQLQWSVMDIPPALQFKLHAHPNIELVYCAKGALHEIRMSGEPFCRKFDADKEVKGPDLTLLDRSWYFDTLRQGEWLVNEVGSIHKSFTATNGDGCILLVLWGGAHADILETQEPTRVNVHQAVDTMDNKLSTTCGCSSGNVLTETFLPASERRS